MAINKLSSVIALLAVNPGLHIKQTKHYIHFISLSNMYAIQIKCGNNDLISIKASVELNLVYRFGNISPTWPTDRNHPSNFLCD